MRQLLTEQLRLFLRRLARHLTKVAVYFDCDAADTLTVIPSVFFQKVGVQTFEDFQAVADQMIVRLFIKRPLKLRLPDGFAAVKRAAFLRRVAIRAENKVYYFAHHLSRVGCAAVGRFDVQGCPQEFVARQRLVIPAFFGVLRVEMLLAHSIDGRADFT